MRALFFCSLPPLIRQKKIRREGDFTPPPFSSTSFLFVFFMKGRWIFVFLWALGWADRGFRVHHEDSLLILRDGYSTFWDVFDSWEHGQRAAMKENLGKFEQVNVLDIGAWIGPYSLSALSTHPGVSVWAIEPDPAAHAQLVENVALNSNIRSAFSIRAGVRRSRPHTRGHVLWWMARPRRQHDTRLECIPASSSCVASEGCRPRLYHRSVSLACRLDASSTCQNPSLCQDGH